MYAFRPIHSNKKAYKLILHLRICMDTIFLLTTIAQFGPCSLLLCFLTEHIKTCSVEHVLMNCILHVEIL